ncbi:MAG: exodeoxyribonuclease III, partial [Desulfatiglandales bacterium]
MKVATFNCNSVRSRLEIIIKWLSENIPDVLCLQETKVQDKDFPEGEFKKLGYHSLFVGQKAYNGVAIITREKASLISTDLQKGFGSEARFLEIEYDGSFILNVYVPQGTSVESERFPYKLSFLDRLLEYLNEHHNPSQRIILAGDFNVALEDIDVYDPEAFRNEVCFHPEEQKRLQKLLEWGLVDTYRFKYPEKRCYTFWDYRIPNGFKRNLGWRIDYILCTKI